MRLLRAEGCILFAVLYVRDGKVGNLAAFAEKVCGATATVRFFHTTGKIVAAAVSGGRKINT